MTCGQQKETALGSLVHQSHLSIKIGIMLFNIFSQVGRLAPQRKLVGRANSQCIGKAWPSKKDKYLLNLVHKTAKQLR